MKKWLTLPLAAGCLVLLAMPALANEGHMNRPSDLSTIPVKGSYQEKLETETVYSVDISWGSMEFVYAKEGTGVWNPETHSYDNVSGAGWQYPAGGPGGLAGNEVQITNHSNTKIVCSLDFTTEEAFPEIVGTFDRPEISISSAEGKAVDDETLTQKSKLNMQGALAEQVVTPTPIGEILRRSRSDAWLRKKRKHRRDASSFFGLRLRHLREHGPKKRRTWCSSSWMIRWRLATMLASWMVSACRRYFSNGRQLALDGVLKKGRQLLGIAIVGGGQ